MLRKLLTISALAVTLSLGACAGGGSPGGGGLPGVDPALVQRIKDVTTRVCGFVPAVATVAEIIATFTGGGAAVAAVEQIASGICSAVTKKGARRGGAKYRGVVIQGDFARR